jgi:hypothetical protein
MVSDYCEVCGLQDQQSNNAGHKRVRVTCVRCGTFEWEPGAPKPTPVPIDRQVKLSAFVREQNAVGVVPFLQADLIQQVERRARPRLRDRALRALAAIVQEVGYDLVSTFQISNNNILRIQAVSHSADQEELCVLLGILEGDGLIEVKSMTGECVRNSCRPYPSGRIITGRSHISSRLCSNVLRSLNG